MVQMKALLGRDEEHAQELEFLVDTGSFYTLVPPDLARELGIAPTLRSRVVLADGRTAEVSLAMAYLGLLDREAGIPVGVMDVPIPLLGATALEALGLKVDPVGQALEHSRPFGPAAL